MSRHRAQVRPRYGRFAALGSALTITSVAVLSGAGMLPVAAGDAPPVVARQAADVPEEMPASTPSVTTSHADRVLLGRAADPETALPAGSGTGRRVVFSQSRQRVWLVDGRTVERTYLVSGSRSDNLDTGTYEVYSRSEQAWGIDDSGSMRYFVRFTQGDNAAIGFHDIPVADGEPVQTVAQLGTPLSHGCIRQKRSDAIALWRFAPVGTTVVVVD